jgi:hypothetical protein
MRNGLKHLTQWSILNSFKPVKYCTLSFSCRTTFFNSLNNKSFDLINYVCFTYSNLLYSFCRSLKSRSTTDKIRLHSSSFNTDNSDDREVNDFVSIIYLFKNWI